MFNLFIKHARRAFQFVGRIGAFCFVLALAVVAEADTFHVDGNAPGSDGSSWPAAFTDLQDALAAADGTPGADVILVAQGTYKPTTTPPPAGRTVSFVLLDEVLIQGGYRGAYDGSGLDPDDRDIAAFETTLSGDIGTAFDPMDNSYHVVFGEGSVGEEITNDAVLDGFTVTGGYASGNQDNKSGAGIFLLDAWPVIKNCTITGNQTTVQAAGFPGGGGIYCRFSALDVPAGEFLRIENCTISNNTSANWGGGVLTFSDFRDAAVAIINTTITGNTATAAGAFGGGVYVGADLSVPNLAQTQMHLVNCTIQSNWATSIGGGVGASAKGVSEIDLFITNCLFVGNGVDPSATNSGGAIGNFSANATIVNCTFTGNEAGRIGGAYYEAFSGLPAKLSTIRNSVFWGNVAPAGGGHEIHVDPLTDVTLGFSDVERDQSGITGGGLQYEGGTFEETNIETDPFFSGPAVGNYRLSSVSPCIDAADTTSVPLDEFDVDDDLDFGELTPDLDLSDRAHDDPDTPDTGNPGPPGPIAVVDMGSYEFRPSCPEDTNGDCVVNVLDLIDVLLCFGLPAVPGCEAEDINEDGTVNVLDLIDLLLVFGELCPCAGAGAQAQSLEEALEEAGLDENDWNNFMDIMEGGTQEEKDNWHCWMTHYLSCHDPPFGTCNPPPPNCPDRDPFGGHGH